MDALSGGKITDKKLRRTLPPSNGKSGSKLYKQCTSAQRAVLGSCRYNKKSSPEPKGPAKAQMHSRVASIGAVWITAPLPPMVIRSTRPPVSFRARTWDASWTPAANTAAPTHCHGSTRSKNAVSKNAPGSISNFSPKHFLPFSCKPFKKFKLIPDITPKSIWNRFGFHTHGKGKYSEGLDNIFNFHYNTQANGVWRSLVSRLVRVQEASGSNPDTPTMGKSL